MAEMKHDLPPNPTKFYTHFLYKAIFLSIFLLVLPLIFPSEAPDFINHTINTTSWELLQLVFVGIAVSYGLFSKRSSNDDDEKQESDNNNNAAHSYVNRLLQVSSSVFDDDDDDDDSESSNNSSSKAETWNSQYYRGEPIVVVAKDDETTTTIEKQPLLLPVRSLKNGGGVCESSNMSIDRSNSSTSRRRFSEESENIVLRSPIPWRSRSLSRSQSQSQSQSLSKSLSQSQSQSQSLSKSLSQSQSQSLSLEEKKEKEYEEEEEKEEDEDEEEEEEEEDTSDKIKNPIRSTRSFRYQSSTINTQDKIHPSFSSEIQSKFLQNKSPIPPPPPPPPPPHHQQQPVKLNTSRMMNKEFRRSLTNDLSSVNRRPRGAADFTSSSSLGSKSFRIPKETEYDEYLSHDKEIENFLQRKGSHKKKKKKKDSSSFVEIGNDDSQEEEEEEDDDELVELASKTNQGNMMGVEGGIDNGPDVDKKADEFIAKFREQIRLQRIASIRRSTSQTPKN